MIEKPFGHDLPSAVALNHAVGEVLEEKQIYRIDHYLGKETVQNILAFRFANGIFEPVWNRRYVDHVQVTVAEELGVELRGGLLRDRRRAARHGSEPHLPADHAERDGAAHFHFDADAVHDEQTKVLRAIQPSEPRKGSRSGRARPVRRGHHRRQARSGISQRAARRARFADADVRRHGPAHRQLALGWRAVLSSHRQAPRRGARRRS